MKCVREALRSTLTSFLWLLRFFQFYQWTLCADLWPLIPNSDGDQCELWSFSIFLNLLWAWCQDHWKSIGNMFPLSHPFICSRTTWECCSLFLLLLIILTSWLSHNIIDFFNLLLSQFSGSKQKKMKWVWKLRELTSC